MLNTLYIATQPATVLQIEAPSKDIVTFFSLNYLRNRKDALKQLSAHQAPPFVVFFDEPPTTENFEWLLRFLFLPAYYKREGANIVFCNENAQHLVKGAIAAQKFNKFILFPTSKKLSITIGAAEGFLFYNTKEEVETAVVINEIKDNSAELKETKDNFHRLMFLSQDKRMLSQVIEEKNNAEARAEEYFKELTNHKEYLAIALKQKETEKILSFYHKEYEVLPLWYKRFGHIIKIIIGKRRLKP